jgi:hypothetical protein
VFAHREKNNGATPVCPRIRLGAQRLGQTTVNAAASGVGDVKIAYDFLAISYKTFQCKFGFGN